MQQLYISGQVIELNPKKKGHTGEGRQSSAEKARMATTYENIQQLYTSGQVIELNSKKTGQTGEVRQSSEEKTRTAAT